MALLRYNALGSLIIQKQLGFIDREFVAEITENPYFQYFIGLPAYTSDAPFVPSLMVEFRKRLNEAREDPEHIIDDICYTYNFYKLRMYRDLARRDYLRLARIENT